MTSEEDRAGSEQAPVLVLIAICRKHVAVPGNGLDVLRVTRVRFDLGSQIHDVHPDEGSVPASWRISPHLLKELVT